MVSLILAVTISALSADVLESPAPPRDVNSTNATLEEEVQGSDDAASTIGAADSDNKLSNATLENQGVKEERAIPNSNSKQSTTSPQKDAKHKQPNYDDEQTYLDLFGERAKELLTQHIIPTTDSMCRWDWRMGRCEPYCECGYFFLWGDFHLGRSCRLRSKFAPVPNESQTKTSSESLQDAWQQWADHMDDPDAFASFVDSGNAAKKTQNECSLPPESRYTQGVYYLTKLLGHGTIVFHQFKKVKHHAGRVASDALTLGKHKFNDGRENACAGLKRAIEERERERNQPVVLTKRGIVWIRRLCGTSNGTAAQDLEDEQKDDVDTCIGDECTNS